MACKFIEISCTVGYNLDNLLVGIRMQLILKHCASAELIMSHIGKTSSRRLDTALVQDQMRKAQQAYDLRRESRFDPFMSRRASEFKSTLATGAGKKSSSLFTRLCKKFSFNMEQQYDCNDFLKL